MHRSAPEAMHEPSQYARRIVIHPMTCTASDPVTIIEDKLSRRGDRASVKVLREVFKFGRKKSQIGPGGAKLPLEVGTFSAFLVRTHAFGLTFPGWSKGLSLG